MTHKKTTLHCTEKRFFFTALIALLILFSGYVYFISMTVVQVVVREGIDRDISHITSYISDLEATYIAAKDSIDEEDIAQYGFVYAETSKVYVEKTPTNLVLLRHDEI